MKDISFLPEMSFRWPHIAEFRRGSGNDISPVVRELEEVLDGLGGVRCPICNWRPARTSLWMCSDCGHPEYFYNGCGTNWNTFETGGTCPTCGHRWKFTTCHACLEWSRHADWYERCKSS